MSVFGKLFSSSSKSSQGMKALPPNTEPYGIDTSYALKNPYSSGLNQIPEMPSSLENVPFDDLEMAFRAYQYSQVRYAVNQINAISENKNLKQWEIDAVEKAFQNFVTKHNSPLAKALK